MQIPRWCCISNLQAWVKVIAVFEVIECVLLIGGITYLMVCILCGSGLGASVFMESILGFQKELQFSLCFSCWTIVFIHLILNVHLYRGASQGNKVTCQIWVTVNVAVLIMGYLWSLISINLLVLLDNRATVITVLVLVALIKFLETLVVIKYLRQIKKENVQVYTIAPMAPVVLNAVDRLRSEIEFSTRNTNLERERQKRRPYSTTSSFENPSLSESNQAKSIDLEASTYPDFDLNGSLRVLSSGYQII